jgi:hypothetical protein
MAAEHYATVVEYTLIAAGIGLLLMATFAPRARKPLAVVFVVWLGLNAYVLVWLVLRVSGGPLICWTPQAGSRGRPFSFRSEFMALLRQQISNCCAQLHFMMRHHVVHSRTVSRRQTNPRGTNEIKAWRPRLLSSAESPSSLATIELAMTHSIPARKGKKSFRPQRTCHIEIALCALEGASKIFLNV